MKVNREREIEIGNLIGAVIVRPDTLPQRERDRAISDLLSDHRDMLAIIKMQLESSGDCRCNGCKRGREFLRESGAMQ